MNTYSNIASDLINRSASSNEIVTEEYEHELSEALHERATLGVTDYAHGDRDFWGTTTEGEEWRVRLRNVPRKLAVG